MGITGLEVALLAVSAGSFAVSFLLPDKKSEGSGIDQELAKEEVKVMIKEAVDQEVGTIRQRVDGVVDESMNDAMGKTERSLEKLSNEKIMAVNEYSDTVMKEIHKNHEEVMFLYDMLNTKQESLKKTVADASKAAKVMQDSIENMQSFRPVEVSYGEGSVKIAPMATKLKEEKGAKEQQVKKQKVNEQIAEEQLVREQLAKEQLAKEQLEKERQAKEKQAKEQEELRAFKPDVRPYPILGRSAVKENEKEALQRKIIEPVVVEELFAELNDDEEDQENKTEELSRPVEAKKVNEDLSRNNNEKILELHKRGKSNVAIAKELGLGVGEVKLVIDLNRNV